MKKNWESYEEVAAYLLNQFAKEFGLVHVEGKQTVHGKRSKRNWEIDAKGVKEGNTAFILVECRRYTTSKQNAEKLAALAYKIIDTGADGGIIVSPLGIQSVAAKIAASANILNVQLDANSTPNDFALKFLNKLMIGISDKFLLSDNASCDVMRLCKICGKYFPLIDNETICPNCIPD